MTSEEMTEFEHMLHLYNTKEIGVRDFQQWYNANLWVSYQHGFEDATEQGKEK